MGGRTLGSALILLVLGNALAIGSDVAVKLLDPGFPLFQFVLMRALATLLLLLPFVGTFDRKTMLRGLRLHSLRAHFSLAGVGCMVIALQTLPLATANALFYTAPLLVVVLSVVFFRERMTLLSALAVLSGFAGTLVILRPVEISWGGLAALGAAASLACNAVLVRKLPEGQSNLFVIALTTALGMPAIGLLVWWEGAAWDWSLAGYALASSALVLFYQLTVLLAYRHVAANQVTSAEYTGLIWAVVIGWLGFGELPDLWFWTGSLMIVLPLLLLAWQHRRRLQSTTRGLDQP